MYFMIFQFFNNFLLFISCFVWRYIHSVCDLNIHQMDNNLNTFSSNAFIVIIMITIIKVIYLKAFFVTYFPYISPYIQWLFAFICDLNDLSLIWMNWLCFLFLICMHSPFVEHFYGVVVCLTDSKSSSFDDRLMFASKSHSLT